MEWVKVLYIVNIVTPKFWAAKRCQDHLDSAFADGLPLKPGGILKPRLGPSSGLRRGAAMPRKKSNKKKKRPNKGKPAAAAPGQAEEVLAIANAISSADVAGNITPRKGKEGYGKGSEKTRAIENTTKRRSDREMKTTFGISDSESEPGPSMRPE
eukprot:9493226-Pyramimonas_sp.AAC.1